MRELAIDLHMKQNDGVVRSMRILHVQASVAPNFGGPTTVLTGLSCAQAKQGHRVTICTSDRDHPPNKRLAPPVLRDLFVPNVEIQAFPVLTSSVLYSRAMSTWLRKSVRQYDVVHIHGLYRFPMSYAAFQAHKQGVPYIVRPCGTLDPYLHGKASRSRRLKRIYEHLFALPSLNRAGAIHYTTEEERQRAAFLRLRAPSVVIPNGLEWERFERLPTRGAFRIRYGLRDTPVVLFLGRLHFKKGLDLLIPAFSVVKQAFPKAQLAIVGPESDDGYGNQVRSWVRRHGLVDSVHFIGPLTGRDVIQAYVDADIFVLPSYTENFGMTVVEAMACGLPVVISDQVNINNEIKGAGAGIVTRCKVGDVANGVSCLLGSSARRAVMGEHGRQYAEIHYSWSAIMDRMTRVYRFLICGDRCMDDMVQWQGGSEPVSSMKRGLGKP